MPVMKLKIVSILFFTLTISSALSQKKIEAEITSTVGRTKKINDDAASGRFVVDLSKPGDGLLFSNLSAARKLAIR